jgi:hypothetical protein
MPGYFSMHVGMLSAAAAAFIAPCALAQDIDPKLRASWDFMQSAMPGVPYETLKAACAEGRLMVYHGSWTDAQNAQIEAFHKRFPFLYRGRRPVCHGDTHDLAVDMADDHRDLSDDVHSRLGKFLRSDAARQSHRASDVAFTYLF